MEGIEIHKKTNNNIKSSRDNRLAIEETKINDFDYHYGDQIDQETETMLHNLNIDALSDNHNVKNDNGYDKNLSNNHSDDNNIDINDNIIENNNDTTRHDNNNNNNINNEQSKSKNKKNQLSALAPEFNVATSSPPINPYGGPFGVQTKPVYVPPAQIPTKPQQPITTPISTLPSNQPPIHSSNTYQNGTHHHNNNGHIIRNGNGNNANNNNNITINNNNNNNDNNTVSSSHPFNSLRPPHQNAPELLLHPNANPNRATPIGSTQPYKTNSRNYGPPPLDAIDPKFTNSEDIRQFQKWELLESAKRWLPGEGTFVTWGTHRYLIGGPIHMGMNGHIHYCYKYPIPSNGSDNKDDKLETDANGQIKLPLKVETVAAKIVPNTPAFAREIYILRALQGCENIAELYEVLESERTLISILELAQADVFNFFVGRVAIRHGWNLDKPAVREHFARMVISNVVQGLHQMHQKNYLHCDLKSLNILLYIYSTGHSQRRGGVYIKAKLTDFGHSSYGHIRTAEKLFSNGMARVGTAGHVAPELFVENAPCGPKIDIWSLGVVMFSMLVPGHLLFGEYTNLETLKKAYDHIYKNPFSRDTPSWWSDFERLSPEARDLILWMTRYDEKERPNEQEILAHPWFEIANQKHNKLGSYRPKLQWADMLSSSIAQE